MFLLCSRFGIGDTYPVPVAAGATVNILELLIDGEWHRISDLSVELELSQSRLKAILQFLSEHGFVDYRESDRTVNIQS